MSRRVPAVQRTWAEWAVRVSLAFVAVAFGYTSVTFSLAQVLAKINPETAHALAPRDGRITALYAASIAGPDAGVVDRARADQLARLSLRQDPTAVIAVSTLGLSAQIGGDTAAARRLFGYARGLSRRDLQTQLWMIEDAVGRNDISGALHQYDITLRTMPGLGDMLFPVLASAISDPAIRVRLVTTLSRRPAWSADFISHITQTPAAPRDVAALLLGVHREGGTVSSTAQAKVIGALIAAGDMRGGWNYYAAMHPGVDARRSRDSRFANVADVPSPFDWVAAGDGGVTAVLERGLVSFTAPASVGGPVMQQLQLLPPGRYQLTGHSEGIDQVDGARPYWVLTCQGGRELGRVMVPNSITTNGAFAGTFDVTADCPVQVLMLVARPSDSMTGLSGQIDRAELAATR